MKTTVNLRWHDICNLLCQETRRKQTTSSSHYSYGQKAYLESSMHWRGKISTLMHRNFVNLYWIHTNFSHLKYDVFRWLIKVTIFTIQKRFKILLTVYSLSPLVTFDFTLSFTPYVCIWGIQSQTSGIGTCAARGNSPLYETSDFAVFPILRFFKTGNGTAGRTIQVDGIACIEVRPLVPKGIFP